MCPRGCCAPAAIMMTIRTGATRTHRGVGAGPSATPARATFANAFTCATCRSGRPSRLFSWIRVISHIRAWLKRKCNAQCDAWTQYGSCLHFVRAEWIFHFLPRSLLDLKLKKFQRIYFISNIMKSFKKYKWNNRLFSAKFLFFCLLNVILWVLNMQGRLGKFITTF